MFKLVKSIIVFCLFIPAFMNAQVIVTIYEDLNGNGIQNIGEPGIGGLNPTLFFDMDMDGFTAEFNTMIVPTQPVAGQYVFAVASNGNYQVVFQNPEGAYILLTPASGSSPLINYPVQNSASAGYYLPGEINGDVFLDVNGNGQDDDGGSLPFAVSVVLENAGNGTTYGPVNTTGSYTFSNLPPGDYFATFESATAAPLVLTFQNVGSDINDSDANRSTGVTANYSLLSGDIINNVDAGYYEPVTIGDFVWEDLNGNGIQEGEPAYPGLSVTLTGTDGTGTPIAPLNVFSNGAGFYQFTNLAPGTYTVTFGALPANFFYTDANQTADNLDSDANMSGVTPSVTVISGDAIDDIDAGLFEAVKIGNYVWEDMNGNGLQDAGEPFLNGVTISITTSGGLGVTKANGTPAGPVVSGPAGAYVFDVLKPGSYIVTFNNFIGYFRTTKGAGNVVIDSDADVTTGETDVITLESGDMDMDTDGGYYRAGTLGDFTWIDFNGDGIQNDPNPLPGVTISITDNMGGAVTDVNGNPINPVVSNGSGNYSFPNLKPGMYKLTFTPPGGYYPNRYNVTGGANDATDADDDSDVDQSNGNMTFDIEILSGEVEAGIDGGFYQPVSIGNFVWHDSDANGIQDAGEVGVDNVAVTINFRNGWAVTDVNNNPVGPMNTDPAGAYLFTNLRPGEYEIVVTAPPMWFFSPSDVGGDATDNDFDGGGNLVVPLVINSNENTDAIDAGIYKNIIIIGTVWIEQDDDGMQQGTEPGTTGVDVDLISGIDGSVVASTTTNAAGDYMFSIKPGDYYISVSSSNFGPGNPLNGLVSCTPTEDPNNDVDKDDNGGGPATGPVNTAVVSFRCGLEPDPDGVTNETIDLCFKFDCSAQNSLAAPSCETVMDTFCDLTILDLGCARMPSPPLVGPAPSPLCEGQGAPHNMSWFAFIAGTGNYLIEIVPFACTTVGNQQGIQLGIYTDCTFTESVFCMANPCTTNTVQISSSILTPGNTYFFWVDGCGGSVCSYEMNILGDFQQFTLEEPTDVVCISTDCSPICPNNTVAVQVNTGYSNLNGKFKWKITSPSGIVTFRTTTKDTLNFTVTELGNYTFTIEEISNKCFATTVKQSLVIEVKHPDDEDFGTVTICPDLVPFYTGPTKDESGDTDPNDDGKLGWLKPNHTFIKGINTVTVMDQGCIFDQTVFLDTFALSPPYNARRILCNDEFPIIFGGIWFTGPTEPVELIVPDKNMCDSTIIVELINLYVDGTFEELGCATGGFGLKFYYTPLDYPTLTTTITWKNEAGEIVDDGNPDNDPTTMIVPSSGTYTVEVTMTMEGKTCVVPHEYILDIGNQVPAIPLQMSPWMDLLCATSDTLRYIATSSDGANNFTWTYPAGLPYVNGTNNDTLKIVWGNTPGGKICVRTSNACGNSPSLCDTVKVIPYPLASFAADSVICITDDASVIYQSTALPGYDFTWNVSGGNIIAGPGSNGVDSLVVEWTDSGIKYITLSVDNQGCITNSPADSVLVVNELAPPNIGCNPGTNSIEFFWTAVQGETMPPAIIVNSGQSGVLSGNTFTVSGLAEGVNVDITATFFTNHPCGNLVSSGGCITQNCVPEQVSFDPIPDICLEATSPTVDLKSFVNSTTTNGNYKFTGAGIADPTTGIFDPKVAGASALPHQILLVYTDATGCISPAAFTSISVKAKPTSVFNGDNIICQDSTANIVYTGSITSGGTFNWNFGPDVKSPGTGAGPFAIGWNTPGNKTITLTTIKDGCTSDPSSYSVTVEPRIPPVIVTCPTVGATVMTFDWNNLTSTSGFALTLNGQALPNSTQSMLSLNNLAVGTNYTLIVSGISNNSCPGVSDTLTCRTLDCPPVSIKFSQKDTTLCLTSNMPVININATITGGLQSPNQTLTWSGPGVTAGATDKSAVFNPNVAGAGTHTIKISLADGSCTKDTTMKITIINKPVSTFTGANLICETDNYVIKYTGTANVPLDWKLPSGVTISRIGITNDYNVVFPGDGNYILGLLSGNTGCISDLSNLNVQVDPVLDTVVITCQQTTTSVTFGWNDISCADQYQVKINNVSKGNQNTLNYLVNNLMVGENVEIEIIPISTCACPAIPSSRVCVAKDCPPVKLTLSTPISQFCEGSIVTPVPLDVVLTGSSGTGSGSWSGTGISSTGIFDPNGKLPGKYKFFYNHTEESCDYKDSISIEIYANPVLNVTAIQPDCYLDNTGNMDAVTQGGALPLTYQLNGNVVTLPQINLPPASYQLVVTDVNKCSDTASFTIGSAVTPTATISGVATVNLGNTTELAINIVGLSSSIDSIVWKDNKGVVVCRGVNCSKIQVTPTENQQYCAVVYYNAGCSISDCFDVTVIKIIDIIFPNVLSSDGNNPSFYIQSYSNIKIIKSMNIYDRWGNKVFAKENIAAGDPSQGWNGKFDSKPVLPGVYVFKLEIELTDGTVKFYSGDVTVL